MTLSHRTIVSTGVCAAFATGLAIGAVPNAVYVGEDPLSAAALQTSKRSKVD